MASGATILVATHNQGKVQNFVELLQVLDARLVTLDDAGVKVEIEETGSTFADNAILKATGYARQTGLLTIADDSGLEVDALDGRPGVHSARYGGSGLTPVDRYNLLLHEMQDVPLDKRTARFRCVIALAAPDGRLLGTAEGICEGLISHKPQGDGGFGYDPVFYVPDLDATLAQLTPRMKHKISHRGRAVQAIEPALRKALMLSHR